MRTQTHHKYKRTCADISMHAARQAYLQQWECGTQYMLFT